MSLIRDEDRCYRITEILTVVSCFSHCYHRSVVVLRVCSTMLYAFVCTVALFHHFAVFGSVRCKHLRVHALPYQPLPVERRVLSKAASRQISERQKQSVASERRSLNDDIGRPTPKATRIFCKSTSLCVFDAVFAKSCKTIQKCYCTGRG